MGLPPFEKVHAMKNLMEKTGLIRIIDTWLKKQGKTPVGDPIFRMIWSTTATEVRHGTFNEFSGTLFVRQVTETRETRKYNYIHDRWILEKWIPPEKSLIRELPLSYQGSYEPIFVFEDKDGNFLEPNIKVVEFIIDHLRNVESLTTMERRSELKTQDELSLNSEIAQFMEQIG